MILIKTEITVSLTIGTSNLLNFVFTNCQGMRSRQFWPEINKETAFVVDDMPVFYINSSSRNAYFWTANSAFKVILIEW